MKRIIFAAALMFAAVAFAAPVSAQDASHCIDSKAGATNSFGNYWVTLYNSCSYKVTVFYCHYRPNSTKGCGEGPSDDNQYYTHSKSIKAGEDGEMMLDADRDEMLHWATCKACYGGWSSKGFSSDSNGNYSCKQCD